MIDAIKKTLLAGLGAAVITKEKLDAALDELVRQGKVSSAEARDLASRLAAEGRREFEAVSQDVSEKLRDRFAGMDRKTQDRLAALEARVAALEEAIAKAEPAQAS